MSNKVRLLMVEDNPGDANLFMELLPQVEPVIFEIECVPRLAAALERIQKDRFDIVLLDLNLPDSNGLDTLHLVWQKVTDIPIVVLTGNNDEQMGLAAIQIGAQDYLIKGQSNGELLARVLRYSMERFQTAKRLRESESLVQGILNSLTSHVVLLDEEGRIVAVNGAWKTFARKNNCPDPNFYLGVNYLTVTEDSIRRDGDAFAAEALKGIRAVMEGVQDHFNLEYPCHSPEKKCWCVMHVSPSWEAHQGVVIAHIDITERKLAEEAINAQNLLLNALINSPHDIVIFSLDREYRYIAFNDNHHVEMLKVWNTTIGKGMNHLEIMSNPELREGAKQSIDRALNGEAFIEIQHKPGFDIHYEFSWNPIRRSDGEVMGVTAFIHDITERLRAEKAILQFNADLEKRVIERTAQLEISNKELEAFSFSVSHDLRAPLRAIDGFSRILMEQYTEKLGAEGNRLLGIVRANTKKMDQLITGLLTLSRVGRIELVPSRIDMTTMAHSIYHEVTSPEVREKFTFKVDPLPDAYGDSTLMRQVWSNLISNAVKYTLPKEERMIQIGSLTENGFPIYFIRDNGVGFNPEYTAKLFVTFQRLHKAEEFDGTGVGLAIVERIIHRHGGKVWAEGVLNQGATFYFTLSSREDYSINKREDLDGEYII